MYLVSVRDLRTGKRVAFFRFPFGQWQAIGFFLSDHEFIQEGVYRVTVSFITENQYRQVPVYQEGQEV